MGSKIDDALVLSKNPEAWGITDKKIKDLSAWAIVPDGERDWYGITLFGTLPNKKSIQVGIEADTLRDLLEDVEKLEGKSRE